jgi:hypothetical protein
MFLRGGGGQLSYYFSYFFLETEVALPNGHAIERGFIQNNLHQDYVYHDKFILSILELFILELFKNFSF